MDDDVLKVLAQIAAEAELPHVVIGGLAVNVWLEPRFTADIDVTVAADPGAMERARKAFLTRGFAVDREHGAGLPSGPDFVRFVRRDTDPDVELQTAKTAYQDEVIARAVDTEAYPGLRVATPEDLIVLKLIAFRAKDRIDLLGLVALSNLDWSYVQGWVDVWEVGDRLRRIRSAAFDDTESMG